MSGLGNLGKALNPKNIFRSPTKNFKEFGVDPASRAFGIEPEGVGEFASKIWPYAAAAAALYFSGGTAGAGAGAGSGAGEMFGLTGMEGGGAAGGAGGASAAASPGWLKYLRMGNTMGGSRGTEDESEDEVENLREIQEETERQRMMAEYLRK